MASTFTLPGNVNLLFAGVGGQGVLLIAELTALAAQRAGCDVKQTEVHGVSQRGGSVEAHVRFGPRVFAPMVTPGEADVVVALEKLEALRFAHFVRPGTGTLLANDFTVIPASVNDAAALYPHAAFDALERQGMRVEVLPATDIARALGNRRMANMVVLGRLATLLPFPEELWLETLRLRVPRAYLEANRQAFAAGRAPAAASSTPAGAVVA